MTYSCKKVSSICCAPSLNLLSHTETSMFSFTLIKVIEVRVRVRVCAIARMSLHIIYQRAMRYECGQHFVDELKIHIMRTWNEKKCKMAKTVTSAQCRYACMRSNGGTRISILYIACLQNHSESYARTPAHNSQLNAFA